MNPMKRQSAAVAGSDDNERLRTLLDNLEGTRDQDFRGVSLQPKPMEDLDKLIPRVSRLDDETSDGVRARESRTKRRSSRGIARFLVAICIGVAGTLAWQSYGQAAKQMLAAKAPELGWSPESKQMIANWVEQLGWTKPPAASESTAVHPSVPEAQVATVARIRARGSRAASACHSPHRPGAGASDSGGSNRAAANCGADRRRSRPDGAQGR